MELPGDLRSALDEALAAMPAKRLATVAADLSQRYRTGAPGRAGTFARSRDEIAAYAAVRLPATYGATCAALRQVRERLPDWEPATLADIGAGPGTAMWAAVRIWPDLAHVTLLEREAEMIAFGKRLAAEAQSPTLREATWMQADLLGAWDSAPHDMVIAAYVLGELPEAQHMAFVQRLWERTAGTLVIIEPGTPAGFARIRQARMHLIAVGAHTIAPCPHDLPCPMADDNWCHFAQRVARSRLHRQVKGGDLAYEDEKFAFVAMSHLAAKPVRGRVIRHPQIQKGHIDLEICVPEGLQRATITRKDRALFRQARDLRWGSLLPAPDAGTPSGEAETEGS
jgi:ribosomal protein RSM22 (predicted rRNA methylase)